MSILVIVCDRCGKQATEFSLGDDDETFCRTCRWKVDLERLQRDLAHKQTTVDMHMKELMSIEAEIEKLETKINQRGEQ